jgi:hypothetical protein
LSDRDIELSYRGSIDTNAEILAAVGWTPLSLQDSVAKTRHLLRLEQPRDMALDDVVRAHRAES